MSLVMWVDWNDELWIQAYKFKDYILTSYFDNNL